MKPVGHTRRVAARIVSVAEKLLPPSRRHWALGMRAELEYLDDGRALGWAIGCLSTGIKERMSTMITGNLKVSRPVLLIEMLLCFVPLTFSWIAVANTAAKILHSGYPFIQKYFLGSASEITLLCAILSWSIIGVLGPIGLLAAFRSIFTGKTLISRNLCFALLLGPALFYVPWLISNAALNPQQFKTLDGWSATILLVLLPIAATLHMLRIGLWSVSVSVPMNRAVN